MDIRISGTVNDSIVDGPGIRYTVFTQGCPHHCRGCHNPQTHDFEGGKIVDTSYISEQISANPLLDGVTFSGGEPFCQTLPLCEIADEAVKLGLNVMTYTGYTFEYLLSHADSENNYKELLRRTDILVDGPFIAEQKSLEAVFRGSLNQRILDCKKSLEENKAVPYSL